MDNLLAIELGNEPECTVTFVFETLQKASRH